MVEKGKYLKMMKFLKKKCRFNFSNDTSRIYDFIDDRLFIKWNNCSI